MGKDFLNLKINQKKLYILVFLVGTMITAGMGMKAYQDSVLQNGYELRRNEAGGGTYEQEVYAYIEGEKNIPLEIVVEERKLTREEAEQIFQYAIPMLLETLKGENESLEKVSKDLKFVDRIPDTPVEIIWSSECLDYFYSDGTLREDVEVLEPVEIKISAILNCQEYCQDFETRAMLLPRKKTIQRELLNLIENNNETARQEEVLTLPKEYQGKVISWKKPMNKDFLIFFGFTICALLFLKLGSKRDVQIEKKARLEQLEKEYAQLVSKFVMLLSAGLSIRNAWERIVIMEQRNQKTKKSAYYEELNRSLREMQKGIPELEVYENFGERIGQIHYKKLMAEFVSYKKRGGAGFMEALNQEMLEVWEERKRKTRQQGEIIGTKLLIPMMGMLAIVFIMILLPAFLSFQL